MNYLGYVNKDLLCWLCKCMPSNSRHLWKDLHRDWKRLNVTYIFLLDGLKAPLQPWKTRYITDKYPPIFSHMQYIANCSDNCLRVIIIYHWTIWLAPGQLRSSLRIITFWSVGRKMKEDESTLWISPNGKQTLIAAAMCSQVSFNVSSNLQHICFRRLSLGKDPGGMWCQTQQWQEASL